MTNYESLIDPTTFGTVADYLQNPNSPIEFLFHVRDRAMLAPLAEQLDQLMRSTPATLVFGPALLDPLVQQGTLLLSPREPLLGPVTNHVIIASSVPRLAKCEVIYLPPLYLVHTPGLFEGPRVRNTVQNDPTQAPRRAAHCRMKP